MSGEPLEKPFNIRLSREQLETLDDMIERHPRISDRNGMMRALFDFGIDQMEAEIGMLTKAPRK